MKQSLCRWLALVIAVISVLTPASAATITHGTSDQWVQENMLKNDPPADYVLNQSTQANAKDGLYNDFFPKDDLQEVRITINETNLNYLLQNAKDEQYVLADGVSIGGKSVSYVGLRTKGNYTLSHSYDDNPNSDRFSFTVDFGRYITKEAYGEKQTFYGCERISFNNFFFDKSMMKEYCAFKILEEMGLPTPQYCLAKLYINDRYYGVYFMVEAMDETVLQQYWDVKGSELSSYLVKPTGTKLHYGTLATDSSPLYESSDDTYEKVADMLPTALEWTRKLNLLSAGQDFDGNTIDVNSAEYISLLESILDLDEVIRYFAASSWLCQMDNMFVNTQNYALYISEEGVATVLPWDYDLSFGCYYPGTAELTANYPVDVMYRLEKDRYDTESETSAQVYTSFPLFDVIYQNSDLMERYHNYMLDCSRIAALGGTVSATGKSYDPGYLNCCIEVLTEPLIEAASLPLADNVYYMNRIEQPKDVEEALPNLSKILAMRAIGVWAQIQGLDTTVCGAGCDLSTLGNAMTGETSNSGTLTSIDAATGIYVTAEYSGSGRAFSPALYVTQHAQDDAQYQEVLSALELEKNQTLLVYSTNLTGRASSDCTLTVPLAQQYLDDEASFQFYSWQKGALTELEMTRSEHFFTGTASSVNCFAVVITMPKDYTLINTLVAVGALALAAGLCAGIVAVCKKRR